MLLLKSGRKRTRQKGKDQYKRRGDLGTDEWGIKREEEGISSAGLLCEKESYTHTHTHTLPNYTHTHTHPSELPMALQWKEPADLWIRKHTPCEISTL